MARDAAKAVPRRGALPRRRSRADAARIASQRRHGGGAAPLGAAADAGGDPPGGPPLGGAGRLLLPLPGGSARLLGAGLPRDGLRRREVVGLPGSRDEPWRILGAAM